MRRWNGPIVVCACGHWAPLAARKLHVIAAAQAKASKQLCSKCQAERLKSRGAECESSEISSSA